MPNFDGRGPLGKGPFTGKGQGYCVVKVNKENKNTEKEVVDMPRGDGTGPMGFGPMTGRGAGYCAGYSAPGYVNPVVGRGYFGRGAGFAGRGQGRGRRNFYYATGLTGWQRSAIGIPAFSGTYSYPAELGPSEELGILKNEADLLKKQLEDIENRIQILNKAQEENSK